MHCPTCVRRLTDALGAVSGVRSVQITLDPPEAQVETDGPPPIEALDAAARRAGDYSIAPPGRTAPAGAPAPDAHAHAAADAPAGPKPSLYPLALIIAFILGVCAVTTFLRADGSLRTLMLDFMAGFFLVFSFFKLLDLRGFADAYQTYDILARRSRMYALVYPFLELGLGVAYLARWQLTITNAATLALMLVGSIGVLRAVLSKRRIRCACLGTALNLPMTTVTLVEDLGMAAMAANALVWQH